MRLILILSVGLILSACTPNAAPPPAEPPAAIESPVDAPAAPAVTTDQAVPPLSEADYMMKPVSDLGLTGSETLADIGALLQKRFGTTEAVEGHYSEALAMTEEGGRATIVFTISGAMDDSIKSQQHVVEVFQPAAVAAGVTGYGVRQQCYRAADPDAWTNQLCP